MAPLFRRAGGPKGEVRQILPNRISLASRSQAFGTIKFQTASAYLMCDARCYFTDKEGRALRGKNCGGAMQTVPCGRSRINAPVSFGLLNLAPAVTEFLKRLAVDGEARRRDHRHRLSVCQW